MQNLEVKTEIKPFLSEPTGTRVQLLDEAGRVLTLTLPSLNELGGGEFPPKPEFSVSEMDPIRAEEKRELYRSEAETLSRKASRFGDSPTFLKRLSSLNSFLGNIDKAIDYSRQSLQFDDAAAAKMELAETYIAAERFEDAEATLLQCDLDNNLYANIRLAYLAVLNQDIQGAKQRVEQALELDTADFSARIFAGTIYLVLGQWQQAIRSFRVAAEANRKSPALYLNMAIAYWALGNKAKSIAVLKKSIGINPVNISAIKFYAEAMFELGRPSECIPRLEKLLRYEQNDPYLWGMLARACYESAMQQNRDKALLRQALTALEFQMKLSANDSSIGNNIGVIHQRLGNLPMAERYFGQAIVWGNKQAEDHSLPYSNLVHLFLQNKQYQKVLALTDTYFANQDHEGNKYYWHMGFLRVMGLVELERHAAAAKLTEDLLANDIDDTEVVIELLKYIIHYATTIRPDKNLAMQFIEKAEGVLTRAALPTTTGRAALINNVIFGLLYFDEIDRARARIGELGKYVHDDPYATATLGLYHIKGGKRDRAIELYRESQNLLGRDSPTRDKVKQRMHLELGKFYLGTDRGLSQQNLQKAADSKRGIPQVAEQARALIRQLKQEPALALKAP